MDRLNILSLLGLSLRGGRLAVGEEMRMTQTLTNLRKKTSTWSPLNGRKHTLWSLISDAMRLLVKE